MPTIRDIAAKAGVSHTVVSAVLKGENKKVRYSEATRRKVLSVAKRMGYRFHRGARSLALKSTLTVGISFAWTMAEIYRHPAMAFVMAGVSEVLSQEDYSLLLRPNPFSEGYLPKPDLFHPNEVDGVLLGGAIRIDDKNLALWRKSKLPTILVSTPTEDISDINCVDIDNFGMAVQAVDFLVQRGYQKIGLVLPSMDYTCHQTNFRGFQFALSKHGLSFHSKWVWTIGYDPESGYKFAQDFLSTKSRPEALVFFAEMAAIGFNRALIERSVKLPDEIGLVIKEKFLGQTAFLKGVAVIEPIYFELGIEAANSLMKLLKGEIEHPVQKFLPTQIRVNE